MINLVAAIDLNCGLGINNELLINLPNDMKHFRELTTRHFVVMGRKTYESIGHPLPNRTNIILTRNKNYKAPYGTFVYHSIEEVINAYNTQNNNESELFFIGGEDIYYQALSYADRIYLTIIKHAFENVDTHFPRLNPRYWKAIKNVENTADENHPYDYHFVTYEPKIKNN
jgi:dihydrofolate reductase